MNAAEFIVNNIHLTLFADVSGPQEVIMQLIANAMVIVSLFIALILAKDTITGVLGGKVSGALNKAARGFGGKGANVWNRSSYARGRDIRKRAKDEYRTQKFASNVEKGGFKAKLARGIPLPTSSSRYGQRRLASQAFGQADKADNDDVRFAQDLIARDVVKLGGGEGIKYAKKELEDAIKNNDSIKARAAQNVLFSQGNKGVDALRTTFGAMTEEQRSSGVGVAIRTNIATNSSYKAKAADLSSWGKKGGELKTHSEDAETWRGLELAETASQTASSMKAAVASGGLTRDTAERIFNDRDLNRTLNPDQVKELESTGAVRPGVQGPPTGQPTPQPGPTSNPNPPIQMTNQNGDLHDATIIQGQVTAAGGFGNLSNDQVYNIREHANTLGQTNNDAETIQLHGDAHDELVRRGIVPK